MQGVTIEVRWGRATTAEERELAAHILEAVIRALRAPGTSGSFRGGGHGAPVEPAASGRPPVCGCLGAGCEGPTDSERHVAPTETPRGTSNNVIRSAFDSFGHVIQLPTAPPGTYGPGDYQ